MTKNKPLTYKQVIHKDLTIHHVFITILGITDWVFGKFLSVRISLLYQIWWKIWFLTLKMGGWLIHNFDLYTSKYCSFIWHPPLAFHHSRPVPLCLCVLHVLPNRKYTWICNAQATLSSRIHNIVCPQQWSISQLVIHVNQTNEKGKSK